jgi:hypothetical protein
MTRYHVAAIGNFATRLATELTIHSIVKPLEDPVHVRRSALILRRGRELGSESFFEYRRCSGNGL